MPEPTIRPTIVGIQGGVGSFNDDAVRLHLTGTARTRFEIRYLYTSEQVMRSLTAGDIDLGQFALYNTVGGFYDESLHALAHNVVTIVDRYTLPIKHALLAHSTVGRRFRKIVTHPAVVHQCQNSIALRLPDAVIEQGTGDFLDPSRVALAIATGELPPDVATISNPRLAEEYGLVVVESNLQDHDSVSWFLLFELCGGPPRRAGMRLEGAG